MQAYSYTEEGKSRALQQNNFVIILSHTAKPMIVIILLFSKQTNKIYIYTFFAKVLD